MDNSPIIPLHIQRRIDANKRRTIPVALGCARQAGRPVSVQRNGDTSLEIIRPTVAFNGNGRDLGFLGDGAFLCWLIPAAGKFGARYALVGDAATYIFRGPTARDTSSFYPNDDRLTASDSAAGFLMRRKDFLSVPNSALRRRHVERYLAYLLEHAAKYSRNDDRPEPIPAQKMRVKGRVVHLPGVSLNGSPGPRHKF